MNETKDIFTDKGTEDTNIREEMGFTIKRGNELVKITRAIIDSHSTNGGGKTSHVLLGIAGRKDLNDTEKTLCTFIFASGMMGETFEDKESDISSMYDKDVKIEMGGTNMRVGLKFDIGMNMDCVVVGPDDPRKIDLLAMTMSLLFSQMRDMPKPALKEFCREMIRLFENIAKTGEVKLW